jgi:hypothetical protein
MTSQTDNLFRKKLENFQQPAPTGAWERIESNLGTANNKIIWFKIAAGVLLLSVVTFILWPTSTPTRNELASKTKLNEKTPAEAGQIKKGIPFASAPGQITGHESTVKQIPVHKKRKQKSLNAEQPIEKSITQDTKKKTVGNNPVEIISSPVASVEVQKQLEVATSTTIVYTAEEVNAKYLRKKSTTDATADAKKTSSVQKLIGLAYALKNNESGLSDLRQKKDEILALNFLTEDKNTKRNN